MHNAQLKRRIATRLPPFAMTYKDDCMIKVIKKLVPILFIIIGSVICINGVALFFVSNLNLGNFLTVALGASVVLTVIFLKSLNKILQTIIIIAVCIVILFSGFLMIYGSNDNVTYKEDAVIVLGAAVHGDTPSLTLKKRLDTAVEYHTQNPDALIIVSGGKGQGENVTEAEAMEKYLLDKGVNSEVIIKESAATSTYENFLFSNKLIKERLGDNVAVTYITNEYHIMRAGLCAKRAEVNNITHIHSNTSISYIISGVLRECLAVVKYIIFKS